MIQENILGINVSVINYESLKETIINDIKLNKKVNIIAINPEKIMKANKDTQLKNILNQATYKIADGIGVVISSKLTKGNIKNRITGIDSMDILCSLSVEKGYKIFLYGAKNEVVSQAKFELEKKYKNIKIVGTIDGYEKNNDLIIQKINDSKTQILFVALGSPKQELWINENLNKLHVNVLQGVGGSFDVISGNIKRAPIFMRKLGLEWLYRLIREPSRVFRQFSLIQFIWLVINKKRKKIFMKKKEEDTYEKKGRGTYEKKEN